MKNKLVEIFQDPLREHDSLTDKQREAARLASQNLLVSEIAEAMNTTTTAVESLLRQVYWKTGMGKKELVKNLIKQIEKVIR